MHPFTKMLNEIQHISLLASLFKIINLQLLIISVYATICLTHWGRVTHICVVDLGHHWFRYWLVACSAPSHYLNLCWNIVYWTFRHKLQWIGIQSFSFKKLHLQMSSAKWRLFCLGLNELKTMKVNILNEDIVNTDVCRMLYGVCWPLIIYILWFISLHNISLRKVCTWDRNDF